VLLNWLTSVITYSFKLTRSAFRLNAFVRLGLYSTRIELSRRSLATLLLRAELLPCLERDQQLLEAPESEVDVGWRRNFELYERSTVIRAHLKLWISKGTSLVFF